MNQLLKMSWGDYHRHPGVNASLVQEMLKSPLHAKTYLEQIAKEPPEPSTALVLGTLTYHLVFEPERPLPNIAVKEKGFDGRSKEGKAWLAEQRAKGATILSHEERDQVIGMASALLRDPICREIIEKSQTEMTLLADYAIEGGPEEGILQRKGRTDLLPGGNLLADAKTTLAANKAEFERSVFNFFYHGRGSYYIDIANSLGLDKRIFIILAVEKFPPFEIMIYRIADDALEAGRRQWQALLRQWNACMKNNHWPGYPRAQTLQEIPEITLPKWAWSQMSL